MQVGTGLALVEEFERLGRFDVHASRNLFADDAYAVAHNYLLNNGRLHRVVRAVLCHYSGGVCL